MNLEAFGISLGVASMLVTVAAVAREVRTFRRRRLTEQLYSDYTFDIQRYIFGGEVPNLSARIQHVAEEVLAELPGHTFDALVAGLSGRLVYSVRSQTGDRLIVKTVLDDRRITRARMSLFNEAVVLGHLNGRGAPQVIRAAFTQATNRPYVLRQMLPGASFDRVLYDLAGKGQPPRLSEVQQFLTSVGRSVAELHGLGVVHGDIKPANIIAEWQIVQPGQFRISAAGPIRLLDFEAAAIVEHGSWGAVGDVTRGTPFYMAPERYAQTRVSPSADVYSLSALSALLLTGRPEVPGSRAGERITTPRLRATIRRGMSVDLLERFQSVDHWLKELDRGFRQEMASDGDREVKWPKDDPSAFVRELSEEALSVAVGALVRYSRVSERIDASTVDALIRSRYSELDAITRSLVDTVWFERSGLDDAAGSLGITYDDAEARLQEFARELAANIRTLSLESERQRGAQRPPA